MSFQRILPVGLILAVAFGLLGGTSDAHSSPKPRIGTHVYLLRGFMGVFSFGIDEIAEKLTRRGISASVHGHGAAGILAEEAAQRYKAGRVRNIVIVGHSLGAGAAIDMASQLGDTRVPVSLVVTLDPVYSASVPSNVRRLVNYYIGDGMGTTIDRSPKFRGSLRNFDQSHDPDMGHVSLLTARAVQRKVIGQIMATVGGGRSSSAPARPQPDL